jgi:hypothetical protein
MKKFFIFCLMAFVMCVNANAQNKIDWGWFKPINLTTFTFGCDVGGNFKNVENEPPYLVGYSLSLFGVYYDKGSASPEGIYSTDIGYWDSTCGEYWHLGYTIPISRFFNITPIVGVITTQKAHVNGHDWFVGYGNVVNRYTTSNTQQYLDYGAVINCILTPYNWGDGWRSFGLTFSLKITNHQTAFNCGMCFNIGEFYKYCKAFYKR